MKKLSLFVLLLAVDGRLASQELWEWMNPLPQGNDLHDLHIVARKIVAVGDLGTIVISHDGGAVWQTRHFAAGFDGALFAVDFVDELHGWCAGEEGVILVTTDGGAGWRRQTAPLQTHLYDILFLDRQRGWAVGRWGKILSTQDGGETWRVQASGSLRTLRHICRISDDRLLIVGSGGTILMSNDRGKSWAPIASPTDANLTCAVFTQTFGIIAGEAGVLLRSTDGGASWTAPETDLPPLDWRAAASFADSLAAVYGIGSRIEAGQSVIDRSVLAFSTDGLHWSTPPAGQNLPILYDLQSSRQSLWAVGADGVILNFAEGDARLETKSTTLAPFFWQPFFLDDRHGWLVGGQWIARTEDGGQSWQTVTLETAHLLYSAAFTTPDSGWAVGGGYVLENGLPKIRGDLYRSTDGGRTWTPQPLDGLTRLLSIRFLNRRVGCTAGENGTLFKTTDGRTWVKLNTKTNYFLFDVHLFNEREIIACGQGGRVIRSSDGGENWKIVRTPTQEYLLSMRFVDSSTGYIAGTGGTILKSTDGGGSWQRLTSGVFQELWSVDFITPSTGWIVGRGGLVLKTTDAGATWSPVAVPTRKWLTAIRVARGGKGFIVGEQGTVLMSRNCATDITDECCPAAPSNFSLMQIYPNPFNELTTLVVNLPRASCVELTILNLLGKEMSRVFTGELPEGEHRFVLRADHWPSGLYFCRLKSGTEFLTKKMIVQK